MDRPSEQHDRNAGPSSFRAAHLIAVLGLIAILAFFGLSRKNGLFLHDWWPLTFSILAILAVVAFVLYVSYQRQSSMFRRLQGIEARHSAMLASAVDGIIVIDRSGLIQSANPAAVKLFGYPEADMLGKNVNTLMPESYAVHHDTYLNNYLTTGTRKIIGIGREVHGKRKDGQVFPLDLAVSEMRVDGQRMFTGIVRDITDRQVFREVKHLKTTLDHTMDGVFMFDPVNLKFIYTNLSAQRSVGYSEAELQSMTPLDIEPRFTEALFRGMIEALMAGPDNTRKFETVHQHKNGSLIPVEIVLQYVAPQDESPRFSAIVRDISEKVEAEQALLAAKKSAELANQQKGEFLAIMSHEIRTPLNGVMGMLELLQSENLDDRVNRWVTVAAESASSLMTIINDILDFSKIEAGQLSMENVSMDLHELVERTAALQSSFARSKGLQLNCYIAQQVPHMISGDPVRLRQVLLNLLNNAVKFTYSGEVSLTVELLEDLAEEVMLRFAVKDSGIGMTPKQKEHLFDAFNQADDSITRHFGGTGLGLNISRRLVHRMGGSINLESQPGKGSLFWFTARFGKTSDGASSPVKRITHPVRVLIADHNETSRENLQRYLSHRNAGAVNCVGDAQATLAALRSAAKQGQAFGALFIDAHLPGSSWQETVKEIRNDENLKSLRLVLMSSFGDPENADLESLIDARVFKPIRQSELFEALQQGAATDDSKPGHGCDDDPALVFQGFRVLLADDSPVNQIVCKEMLQMVGIEVVTVQNGQQAFDALDGESFDLILLDCHMPVLDGFGATRLIRDREEKLNLPRIPIIAATARAMEGDRQRCLEAGMDDYLAKPLRFTVLVERLSHWLLNKPSAKG